MAVSHDVLVTALQELLPGYQESFTLFHPAFDAIVDRGNKTHLSNPFKEFTVVPEGPGTLNDVTNPDIFINGGRRQSAVKGSAYAATMIYAYDVPGEDLRMANGPADVAQLIKKYPERALMDFQERLARQLVMGDSAGATQFFTMNGDATYNPKGQGAQSGMFEFAAPTAQISTRFGIVSNSIEGWHTQYSHITSMAGNGFKQLRKAYWDASQQGSSAEGDVDLLFADRDSYDNVIDELTDYVQFIKRDADVKKGDPAPARMRTGVRFQNATLYPEPQMDRTAFSTTAATEGVIYGLKSDSLNLFTQGSDSSKETKGDFEHRVVGRLPFQELFREEYVVSMGFYSDDLRCNFATTGAANP
jgi:hypothetical protein